MNRGTRRASFEKLKPMVKTKKSPAKTAAKSIETTPVKTTAPVASVAPKPVATAPAAPAVAKAPAPAAPAVAKAPAAKAATNGAAKTAIATIDVKLDVGFGNAVFVRGQGAGLTWEHGQPLVCVDGKTWRWTSEVKEPVTFKLLINDKVWSAGNDLTIAPGQKLEIAPEFA
jgi:hypothetical protein